MASLLSPLALLLVAYFFFIIVFAIGVCFLWPDFVDSSDPPQIRTALFIALLTMKLAAYALGFREIGKNVGWFVLAILCCVFTLPIVWLTALPIGDVQSYHQKHDVVDEDIAMRLWRIIAHPASEDRAAARSFCRRVAIQTLVLLVRIAPPLRPAILKLDPSLGRVLGKAAAV
eukprot:TRINITY_DN42355_c0_g1_i2.p1 TRINITY_DN42355_c0_g1~~TRINITY_DN42355_c0_g1_i2.p1  ORF type:complete len:173 (-),score=21.41 TRINITY_DN42355_c0_g1_i2:121-639(-)